jgi:dihydropteroate synthase
LAFFDHTARYLTFLQKTNNQLTINCKGRLLDLSSPIVMGILNCTPDSFFDGGRYVNETAILEQAEKMLLEGATMLDIGGASSRPGATVVDETTELRRVIPTVELILKYFPATILSVDTESIRVARAALNAGAAIWNDISALAHPATVEDIATVGAFPPNVPYILMHMQGTPDMMQENPVYQDVVQTVLDFFIQKIKFLRTLGINDIVLDPGFGFGKTVEHNFTLLRNIHTFKNVLQMPVLAGVSRKSMICKPLGIPPSAALNGTTALHVVALQQGASILRAHDVREAMEVIALWKLLEDVPPKSVAESPTR